MLFYGGFTHSPFANFKKKRKKEKQVTIKNKAKNPLK